MIGLMGGLGTEFALNSVLGKSNKATNSSQTTNQPWTMNNQTLNGRNFNTSNFGTQADGRPNALPFESIRDANGNVGSGFTLAGGSPISMDQTAYNKYLSEATSDGPSSWALAAQNENKAGTMNNLNNVAGLGASASADAMSGLQMSGGMSGAARERIASGTARDTMKARMDVLNKGNTNNLGILSQDAQMKSEMLPQAYNMSMNNAKFDQDERAYQTDINQFNLTNKLNDVSGFNNYNQNMYNEAMQGWAALKTSEAQSKAAQGQQQGGFVSNLLGSFGL